MGSWRIRRSRRVAATGLVAVAAISLTGTSSGGRQESPTVAVSRTASADIAGKVTIAVALNATRRGTFKASGAFRDSGPARASLDVLGKRVRMSLALEGKSGKLRLLVTQTCGKAASTWTVHSGSRAYNELSGRGKGSGRITCGGRASHRGVYTGVVSTPPPTAVARPGTFSGTGFSPNLRMTFDVLPDGRTLTNMSFRQLVVRCQPPALQFPDARLAGRYPLSDKGRFSITAEGFTVTGRVSGTTAKGTIAYESGACKAESVNWKAGTPPPLLPAVSPGRYCGFTLAGSGVCLDGAGDAWVTRIRFEVKLRCFDPEVTTIPLEYVYGGALGVLPDLSFAGSLSDVPLPGGGSLRFSVAGRFDDAERVSGKGGFTNVTVVRDGTRYRCRNAVSNFTAKLGA